MIRQLGLGHSESKNPRIARRVEFPQDPHMLLSSADLAAHIDQTLILPDATADEVRKLCDDAMRSRFACVCVNPCRVLLAHHHLIESDVKVCAMVSFPLGATDSEIKAHEAELAIDLGAQEIEVVLNLGFLKDGSDKAVLGELRGVVEAAQEILVKAVIEPSRLSLAERGRAASLIIESGARMLVLGTGYYGTSPAEVSIWREIVGNKMEIKVAGSIRDFETALPLIEAGANRIGTTEGVSILQAYENAQKG